MNDSLTFIRSLKTYGNVEYCPNGAKIDLVSIHCVIGIDKKSFQNKCNPAPLNFNSSINLNAVASELFKDGEV